MVGMIDQPSLELQFFILCGSASSDLSHGKLTARDIVVSYRQQELPTEATALVAFVALTREPMQFAVTLEPLEGGASHDLAIANVEARPGHGSIPILVPIPQLAAGLWALILWRVDSSGFVPRMNRIAKYLFVVR